MQTSNLSPYPHLLLSDSCSLRHYPPVLSCPRAKYWTTRYHLAHSLLQKPQWSLVCFLLTLSASWPTLVPLHVALHGLPCSFLLGSVSHKLLFQRKFSPCLSFYHTWLKQSPGNILKYPAYQAQSFVAVCLPACLSLLWVNSHWNMSWEWARVSGSSSELGSWERGWAWDGCMGGWTVTCCSWNQLLPHKGLCDLWGYCHFIFPGGSGDSLIRLRILYCEVVLDNSALNSFTVWNLHIYRGDLSWFLPVPFSHSWSMGISSFPTFLAYVPVFQGRAYVLL